MKGESGTEGKTETDIQAEEKDRQAVGRTDKRNRLLEKKRQRDKQRERHRERETNRGRDRDRRRERLRH